MTQRDGADTTSRLRSVFRHNLTAWLVLALAAILAALPLLTTGYSCGHDFDFHLRSWMEASTQWRAGILRPVWSFHAAWNAGEPRLLFYPPLSWITGALLTLVVPWNSIVFAFTALVLFLCGITMHRLLARWTAPGIAILGGCLYMVNPYMLFCAYERTAYAEFMAAAWMPLLLAALLRDRISTWRVAVAVALLWLTNAPAGVMGYYTVLLIAAMRFAVLLWRRDKAAWPFAANVTAGVVLGFFLDSAYLLPFALQRKYISLNAALTPGASPTANFLYQYTNDEFHNGVLLHSSNIAVTLVGIALLCGIALLLNHRRIQPFRSMNARDRATIHSAGVANGVILSEAKNPEEPSQQQASQSLSATRPASRALTAILVAFSAIILLLQTPLSTPIWHHAPELNFMQFPWRFLAVQGAVTTALLALLLHRLLRKTTIAAATVAALIIVTAMAYGMGNRTFRQGCDDEEGLQPQWTFFHEGKGFEQTDEYTPADDDNDALKISLPEAWTTSSASGIPSGRNGSLPPGQRPPNIKHQQLNDILLTPVATGTGQFLIIRLRAFHGWHVLRDGAEVTDLPHRADGLIAVPLLTAGLHRVEVRYRAPWDEWAGAALSVLTLFGLVALARHEKRDSILP